MNKITIILLAVLCPLISFAQFANQEYIKSENKWSQTTALLTVDDRSYIAGHYSDCGLNILTCIDANNNIMFTYSAGPYGEWGSQDLVYNPTNSSIVGCANSSQFSEFIEPENDGPIVFGIDENGDELFQNTLDFPTYGIYANNNNMSITHNADGNLVMAVNEHLIFLTSTGDYLNQVDFNPDFPFNDIEYINENYLVAITDTELLITDQDGSIQQTQSIIGIQSIYVKDDIVYCLKADELIAYSTVDQTMTSTSDYMTNIDLPQGICGNNDYLIVYEKNNQNAAHEKIIQLDRLTLQYLDGFYFEQDSVRIKEIEVNESNLFIAGSLLLRNALDEDIPNWPGILSGSAQFIKTSAMFTEPQFLGNDIGISNFEIVDPLIPTDTNEVDYVDYVYFESPTINVTYDLTNYGSFPISAYALFSNEIIATNWCVDARLHKQVEDAILAPGETVTIYDTIYISTYHFLQALPTWEFSISVYAPNHNFDGDNSNNFAFSGGPLVGINNIEKLSGISVFPNPVTDRLHLDFETIYSHATLKIYNLLGQIVYQQTVDGHQEVEVKTKSWPAGAYVVMVEEKNRVFTEKIIK